MAERYSYYTNLAENDSPNIEIFRTGGKPFTRAENISPQPLLAEIYSPFDFFSFIARLAHKTQCTARAPQSLHKIIGHPPKF